MLIFPVSLTEQEELKDIKLNLCGSLEEKKNLPGPKPTHRSEHEHVTDVITCWNGLFIASVR